MHEYPPEVEKRIRAECKRFQEPIPKRILEKPDLHFGNALFLNAWFDLDTERERPDRILRTHCFNYADDYEFDLEQKEDLWFFVSQMDFEFINWWKKRQPKAKRGKHPEQS